MTKQNNVSSGQTRSKVSHVIDQEKTEFSTNQQGSIKRVLEARPVLSVVNQVSDPVLRDISSMWNVETEPDLRPSLPSSPVGPCPR